MVVPSCTCNQQQSPKPEYQQAFHSPSRPLTMVPNIVSRIRMNQRTKRPPPHHKPAHKSAKLLGIEHIHLEHADRVRADRSLEHRVDTQFGELAADPLVQFFGVLRLRGGGLLQSEGSGLV